MKALDKSLISPKKVIIIIL